MTDRPGPGTTGWTPPRQDGPAAPAPAMGQGGVVPALPPRRWTRRVSAGHVVMLTAALVAVLVNYSVLRAHDDTVRVAVAAEALRPGAVVSPQSFAFVDVGLNDELQATLITPDALRQLDGWVATSPVGAGELVRARDLQPPSAPASQRAMSLPIDPAHAVAGALEPGDRVDVIEVRDGTARYLVTDVEVLAVSDAGRAGLEGLSGFSVTLAVDDETALRLARALHSGAFDIVRSTGAAAAGPAVDAAAGAGPAPSNGTAAETGPALDSAAPGGGSGEAASAGPAPSSGATPDGSP